MKRNKIFVLVILYFLLVNVINVSAWWGRNPYSWLPFIELIEDHRELTNQALDAVANNDTLNKYQELYNNYKDKIRDGANKLDKEEYNGGKPKNKPGYTNFDTAHFYHPNGSTISDQWPSALEEANDWLEEAISAYAAGSKSAAYLKLGYMIHLLEDMAVPSHTHLIFHGTNPFDYLEMKADANDIDASNDHPIHAYSLKGNDLYAIEQQFNELARKSYNESDVQATIDTYYQDGSYIGSNQPCGSPLVGQTCSPEISSGDVNILESDLMRKAVVYSAGLAMRVHDIFKSLEWPTFHHDNQRTGFTLLKGDMAKKSDIDKINLVLIGDVTQDDIARASIADIEFDGYMDTVITTSRQLGSGDGYIYGVKSWKPLGSDKIKTEKEWGLKIGRSIKATATIGDIDNNKDREVVFGLDNGTFYAIDINGDASVKWTYPVNQTQDPDSLQWFRGELGNSLIEDIDLDGKNEIIFADSLTGRSNWPGNVYVLEDKGTYAQAQNKYTIGNGGAWGAISSANIDNDDNPEIIVPSYYGVFVLKYQSGNLIKICNTNDGKIENSVVIYDIDRDNEYELIYTTSTIGCAAGRLCLNKLYIKDAKTCNDEGPSPINLGYYSRTTPSIANLDSDPNYEIVISARDTTDPNNYQGRILCYDATTGADCPSPWPYLIKTLLISPDIADIDNDGKNNIIVVEGSGNNIHILNNDGSLKYSFSVEGIIGSAPAIGDLDKDGFAEIAVKRAGSPISVLTTISGFNQKPELDVYDNITAIAGDLIDINETGGITAYDNEDLEFYYSSPFNATGLWQSSINDSGNYSIFVEASDGNLSTNDEVTVRVFNSTTKVVKNFSNNNSDEYLLFFNPGNQSVTIKIPKKSKIIYAKLKVTGLVGGE